MLTVRGSGERQQEFLKVTMSDILISSWKQEGTAGDEVPMDQVSMNFSKIRVDYTEQSLAGGAGETTSAGWDVKTNTKF
jgi:type VI secretion system secreted protein Hcp